MRILFIILICFALGNLNYYVFFQEDTPGDGTIEVLTRDDTKDKSKKIKISPVDESIDKNETLLEKKKSQRTVELIEEVPLNDPEKDFRPQEEMPDELVYEKPFLDAGIDEALIEFIDKKKASFPDSNIS